MLPVSDFNFMVAGIATLAATVGYSYARGKLTPTTTGSSEGDDITPVSQGQGARGADRSEIMDPAPSTVVSRPLAVQESLKRKVPHDGFEEQDTNVGYPHNLSNIYPRKRHRTPTAGKVPIKKPIRESTPSLLSEDSSVEDWTFIQSNVTGVSEPPRTPSPGAETAAAHTPATEAMDSPLSFPSPIPTREDSPVRETTPLVEPKESIEEKASAVVADRETPQPMTLEVTPEPGVEKPKNVFGTTSPLASHSPFSLKQTTRSPFRTRGFADFAGDKSPFSRFTSSPNSLSKPTVPAWLTNNDNDVKDARFKEDILPLAATHSTSAVKPITNHVTGEENENVEMDLKNVKLFTKRGDKPFTEGVVGHLKLLADRTTLEERLLFRREPIWKVSMNVRVNPPVRCSYDVAEHVLRIITQEPKAEGLTGEKDPTSELEIVVYAMKPSRSCSKQDFKDFSEMLLKNPRLAPPGSA
ncbi:hypothetical protein AGABI1DRAFT_125958 [Agaricus bisporus var. burnettii JB137-S8]|uniref:RanBD1 domain-containing protein n=1 Tax=Agaricus bisporus var. burnettii (strain JB137-S8 / ATCC MYA-4627 / FGSC 10392) TaxID=597362 RepID=K5XEJ7_AGABU|nr:uncharacterized protein AGABI1DRAFT_125958 [Agaricus bisporus var. burnettii JB137-S8]EKM81587.1 hypothetical protein AGABI1DRAFT_125958 [Agaricus bisporus var. burnettii JB137-S8]